MKDELAKAEARAHEKEARRHAQMPPHPGNEQTRRQEDRVPNVPEAKRPEAWYPGAWRPDAWRSEARRPERHEGLESERDQWYRDYYEDRYEDPYKDPHDDEGYQSRHTSGTYTPRR